MIFMDITLRNVFTANFHLATVVSVKFAAQTRVCTVLCKTSKKAVNLSVHQHGRHPSSRIREILDIKAASVVQQVNKYSVALRTLLDAQWLKWGKALSGPLL
jgi:hypothetical protein